MEAQLIRRPAAISSCCRLLLPTSSSSTSRQLLSASKRLTISGDRQKSTRARMKRAMNVPPAQSFLMGADASAEADHIIFNPPSSAPSVFHTPFKFLPKSDPRRRANLPSLFASSATIQFPSNPAINNHGEGGKANIMKIVTPGAKAPLISRSGTGKRSTRFTNRYGIVDDPTLPPVVLPSELNQYGETTAPSYGMTPEKVEEMRRLRLEDPVTNTVTALAAQYGCSKLFVLMCCKSPKEHYEAAKKKRAEVVEKYGPRRRAAHEDRKRRLDMLFRGEL
ncbi:mitochondrial ribosomal protein subunit L20-domain-containing protein [Podospora didyma]|uniref:Mitochondrial ribosomal protein subunit L20-domain-containing protein n=1 Tax=Podospora didyma TaxID=330526 RepID=A0AAE0NBR8_9PEZI|nr:mitochondrial ribosomal protein subunit L20-domain-containing protein [Podospora didyma]